MKIQVIFGSDSDKPISDELVAKLSKKHLVRYITLSAHRNLDQLQKLVKNSDADIFVCGAGLAAHLPGVTAAMTEKPVFGMPVSSQMGGVDAFLSIAQMPTDVPVLSAGAGCIDALVSFLEQDFSEISETILLEVSDELRQSQWVQNCLQKAQEFYKARYQKQFEVVTSLQSEIGIYLSKGDTISKNAINIFVKENAASVETAIEFYTLALHGGLWLGVNRLQNAVIMYEKLLKAKRSL